jgi:cytochrome P450
VAQLDSAYDYRSRWVLHQEGEPHAALRALFSEPLTPQAVQASAGTVRTICLELFTQALREGALEGAPGISEFCLVEKVARPFPLKVFCSLFELSDLEHIFSPEDITALATGAASAGPLLNATKAAKKVLSEKKTALEQAIASSVWGKKVLAASEVSQVSATLLANVIFYLLAGHETTGGLLGNLVETMIKKPEVWREVQKDYFNANGELIKKALSEVLRYEPPVRTNVRHVVKDHLLEGQEIKSGDVMIVSITAANRDPSQFGADAAEFNIHRSKGLGLAFGAGTHFCHGTHLALLEAKTFLKVALDHVDHFEFIDQRKPERLKDLTFGSFTKFPVRAIARQYS